MPIHPRARTVFGLSAVVVMCCTLTKGSDDGNGDDSDTLGSAAGILTYDSAPWSMDGVTAQLWSTDPDNNGGRYRSAMLILTSGAPGCTPFGNNGSDVLQLLAKSETGLMFELLGELEGYDTASEAPSFSWPGFYSAYSYSVDGDVERRAGGFAYHEGTLLYLWNDPVWVRIDSVTKDTVRGEFFATFWSGDFSATDCGQWWEPAPTEDSPSESEDWADSGNAG